ncbi:unnamed protein product [Penicillium salamii]|uniref:Uncharacterized protein n=2 Tax=Penicillium salamii TaxID=1612424 RepID=A0A9W4ING2_9EURO|nr:unnamed protein product [Penicillium salamii]
MMLSPAIDPVQVYKFALWSTREVYNSFIQAFLISSLPSLSIFKMVRGADFDNGVPQSDNPIENGPNKAHGTGDAPADLSRSHKAAPMPEETGSGRDVFPGQASGGYENTSGSGKGGHEPKSTGEQKGHGALPGQ